MTTRPEAPLAWRLRTLLAARECNNLPDADLATRFATTRDEAAFAAMVRRHGPMVLRVARRITGSRADAEDVYQAAFFVLARKAETLRWRHSVGNWLYGVAVRLAQRSRSDAARRRAHEARLGESGLSTPRGPGPPDELSLREGQQLLDAELARLPEKYRAPMVLCYLEGLSRDEAARELGWRCGLLKSRLEQARELLRRRLSRRGLTLQGVLAAGLLAEASAGAVPRALERAVVTGAATPESVPAPADRLLALSTGAHPALRVTGRAAVLTLVTTMMAVTILLSGAPQAPATLQTGLEVPDAADRADDDRPTPATVRGTVVDVAGKPVGGATVSAPGHASAKSTLSAADGSFLLEVGCESRDWFHLQLVARGADGRLGLRGADPQSQEPVRVVLKPARDLAVAVSDGQGNPVSDAEVFVQAPYCVVSRGRTSASGEWRGRVPLDATDWAVFARRPGVGLDFALARTSNNYDDPLRPLPGQIALKLLGSRTVRVRTLDYRGDTLSGIRVGPWLLRKSGQSEPLNLSGSSEFCPATDKDGKAVIDWLPAGSEYGFEIWAVSDDYANDSRIYVRADEPDEELKFYLRPRRRISGRVTDAAGQPAGGVRIEAAGLSGQETSRAVTRTNAGGRYQMKVHSDYTYVVLASAGDLVAPYRPGIRVHSDESVNGVDFVLCRATRVVGQVTVGKDNRPGDGIPISVIIDSSPQPADARHSVRATLGSYRTVLTEVTGRDGRFAFRLGPGDYWLDGPAGTGMRKLTVPTASSPAEIVHDFHLVRPEVGRLDGRVLDPNGKPVAGAVIGGQENTGARSAWHYEGKSDARGSFALRRPLEPALLFARNSDFSLASLVRLEADDATAKVVLAPCAKASGRLLDRSGRAITARELTYGIRIWRGEPETSVFMDSFGGKVVTDAAGQFTLPGLVPGQTYYLMLTYKANCYQPISVVRPEDARPLDLGEMRVRPTEP
jgi:RNA polymerase sigma factor (sigma-70 family)